MGLLNNTVGRKVLMAITGQLMVFFVIIHMLGNSSIFLGPNGINAYAEHLHSLGFLVWIFRAIMATLLVIHVVLGIQISLENRAACPTDYAVYNKLSTTFAGKTMLYSGLLLLVFIIFHLLHFTVRIIPGLALGVDAQGRFDVYSMIVSSFRHGLITAIYVAAMMVLFFHLSHGIQSFFQTMGWSDEKTRPVYMKAGIATAVVLFLGYVAIPLSIISGFLKS